MKAIFSLIISGALAVSGYAQTRNVLVGTNNAVVQPTNFWSADASNARTGLGLGTAATNPASAFQPSSAVLSNLASSNGVDITNIQSANISGTIAVSGGGTGATNAETARTNLGLPWSGLTNSDASTFQTALFGSGTNPVLVDTNGSVITPSNFWQAAPIATALQNSFPTTNSTNAANSARLLFLFSLAPSTVGVTNTITLPTNGNTFNGDVATITHSGPTSSVTAIRQLGASTNIITLNQVDESVRFIYRNNQWTLMDNISYIEPIYFSGTNAAANAAASRTNLGGTTVGNAVFIATNAAAAANAIGLGATNNVLFNKVTINDFDIDNSTISWGGVPRIDAEQNFLQGGNWTVYGALGFNNATNAAITRTNLGLGQFKDAVGDNWAELYDNGELRLVAGNTIIFFEAFDFGGTNAANFREQSRNSLGLGITNDVRFNTLQFDGSPTQPTNFSQLGLRATASGFGGFYSYYDGAFKFAFAAANLSNNIQDIIVFRTDSVQLAKPLQFVGTNSTINAATTRTNLGLPLAALTNTSVTNFQKAIFYTNTAPSNIGGNLGTVAAWIEIVASNGVTYKIPAYTNVP